MVTMRPSFTPWRSMATKVSHTALSSSAEHSFAGRPPSVETIHQGRVRRVAGEIQWIPLPPAEEVAPLLKDRAEGAP